MALHRNLVIRGGSITDEMQNSDIDTDTSSSESDMDLDGEDRPPALPERDADDNATLVGSTMDCDEATLAGSAADADEIDHLADLPSADDYEAMKRVVLTPLAEDPAIIEDAHFTWTIEGWRQLPKKYHSPTFEAGGNTWRVLFFPLGQDNADNCSFYLEHFSEKEIPDDWYCCAQFSLVLWNPNNPKLVSYKTTQHRFTKSEGDWGFTQFEHLRKIFNTEWNGSGRPLVENESAKMSVYVRVVKDETGVLWHTFRDYDSKKVTGYVGLKNQGATCYLNSLLQSLYFTNAFRKAVYQIPTENEEDLMNSAYTLQRLFYMLQSSPGAVSTNELTKSFGWQTRHIFEQQDVQELSRKLMERMEEKMKGTDAENVLPRLFCGKVKTYISCINVDYESSRVEDFWDIQLNVRGNKNVEESFKDYIEVEKMDGENQYFAGDEFKLQDANKGVIFQSFPEVLHLQLKRFEYDIERDAMMKINDRYEFPETFDASPYLSDDADKTEPYIYQLHSVLVHSGDLNAGHYYAFIKPTKDGHFYRFDDDRVTRATEKEVLEENFGGEGGYPGVVKGPFQQQPTMRQNSAYMLVYIRQSRMNDVLLPVTEEDSPPHLKRKINEEVARREAIRKEKEEQHLYTHVRVLTDETFKKHSGIDLGLFGTAADIPGAAKNYRVLKSSNLKDLAATVAEEMRVDSKMVRFWGMVNRQNKTIRPDTPMTDMGVPLEKIIGRLAPSNGESRLWAEVAEATNENGEPMWHCAGDAAKNDEILLFLKWFDIENQRLRGIGHFYVTKNRKAEDLLPIIAKKMGWSDKDAEKPRLKLYEEIKPQMIEPVNPKVTLKVAELQDGDIICVQKIADTKHEDKDAMAGSTFSKFVPSVGSSAAKSVAASGINGAVKATTKRPSNWMDEAPQFYDYLQHRRTVRFTPHPKNAEPYQHSLEVELSLKFSYDQIAARVGELLGVNPTHLRFHTITQSTGNIKTAVKRLQNQTLSSILQPSYSTFGNTNIRSDELCFEVLEMSLSELDTKKPVKVVWLSEGITKEETFDLLAPKTGTIDDVIALLIKKAQLEDEETKGPIRIYGVHNNKFYKELNRDYAILNISDFVTLVAERVPEDERNARPSDFIQCFHFQGEPNKAWGIPFRVLIKEGEIFSDTKKRLEAKTGIKGKNFEKIKFAVVKRGGSYSKPTYLQDDSVLWDVSTNDDDLLGLDHPDRTRRNQSAGPDLFLK